MIPPLQPNKVEEPMAIVGVDIIDMGRSTNGFRYILTIIDAFTKLAGAYPLKDKKAPTVAKCFMERWVLEGGRIPRVLQSDNGGEFMNETMKEIAKLFAIDRKTTLPYHSRANGLTERFNRTIEEIIKRIVTDTADWDDALPYACYAYNNSPHTSTGESPFFMAYGRDEPIPVGEIPRKESPVAWIMNEYKERMMNMGNRMKRIVKERLAEERTADERTI